MHDYEVPDLFGPSYLTKAPPNKALQLTHKPLWGCPDKMDITELYSGFPQSGRHRIGEEKCYEIFGGWFRWPRIFFP